MTTNNKGATAQFDDLSWDNRGHYCLRERGGDDRIWWLEFGVGRHLTPYPSCFFEHRSLKNRYWGLQYIDTGHNNFLFLPTVVDIIGKIVKTTDWPDWPSNVRVFMVLFLPYLLLLQGRMSSLKWRHLVTDWVCVGPLHLEGVTGLFMAIFIYNLFITIFG